MSSKTAAFISNSGFHESIESRNSHQRMHASIGGDYFQKVNYFFLFPGRTYRKKILRNLEVFDVDFPELGRSSVGKLFRAVKSFLFIKKILLKSPPDLIVCVDPFLSGIFAYLLSRIIKRPYMVGLVSAYRYSQKVTKDRQISFLPNRVTEKIESFVLSRASKVVVDREFYKKYLLSIVPNYSNLSVLPMYLDAEFFNIEPQSNQKDGFFEKLGLTDPSPVLYVGRLSPEKYSDDLIRTFIKIKKHFPHRELLILGGQGSYRDNFIKTANEAQVMHSIFILENLTREQMATAYARCGVLLAPHAGYVALEAAACGAAIVAYDFEWHPEIIKNHETGILVPYRDWSKMADEALVLYDHPTLAQGFRARLQHSVRSNHAPDIVIQSTQHSFEETITGSKFLDFEH